MNRFLAGILFLALSVAAFAQHDSKAPAEPTAATKAAEEHAQTPTEHETSQAANGKAQAGESKGDSLHETERKLKQSAGVAKLGALLGIKDVKTAYWIFTIVNFLILFFAIGRAARKKLPGMFRSRGESIQRSMEEARKSGTEAQARLSDIETRLARLDAEIASIRANAEEQGRTEEQRLLAATEDEKKKIVEAAEQEIAAASAAAQRELKQFVAGLAISLAEKKIQVNESADQELVRRFAQGLGGRGGNA